MPKGYQYGVNYDTVSQCLRGKRAGKRITQSALAAKMGISQPTVSHNEQYPQDWTIKEAVELCKHLGVSITINAKEVVIND